tara:strand:- start:1279 stop:2328 length:1050 start_codon:yes stop_codon:yes gene_type:complete
LESNWWSKVKWFWERVWDFKRKSYPLSSIGAKLIGLSALGSPLSTYCLSILFPPEYQILGVEFSKNMMTWMTFILLFIPMFVGTLMVFAELKSFARNTARVLITGLPGASTNFPTGILSKSEQRLAREVIVLSIQEDNIEKQITRYNAEVCVDLFGRFVLHNHCEKLYIGGLARIPFLVAYGVFLRNVSNIVYFDKIHRDTNWRLLNDEDLNIQLNNEKFIAQPNESGDIGIALSFSTPILKEQLPSSLQNVTSVITPTSEADRNLILNQENLQRTSASLAEMIDVLSRNPDVKRIHLFLSIQSSLAIEIGRKFQEGIHKPWVIHNFDGKSGQYEWGIELSNKGVKLTK